MYSVIYKDKNKSLERYLIKKLIQLKSLMKLISNKILIIIVLDVSQIN